MNNFIQISTIIKSVSINNICCYILLAIILSFLIRLILCIFKSLAITNGESDSDKDNEKLKGKEFKAIFKQSFLSNSGDVRIDDYWLPVFIGFTELLVFPILMVNGFWKGLVGWIGIKALSSWGGRNTRTAYNRFLWGNILSLMAAILIAILCFK